MSESSKAKMRVSERLRPEQRIRQDWEFKLIFEKGKFVKSAIFHLWVYKDTEKIFSGKGPWLGLVVGKKTHLRAHIRNLWKRRIREVFRKNQAQMDPETAVLLQARRAKEVPGYLEMASDMKALLEKARRTKA